MALFGISFFSFFKLGGFYCCYIEMALFGISFFFFFFLHISEETFTSRRKKICLATPGAFIFNIRSNYGI